MRSRFLSHGRAVLVLVPFLALGCNDSTPPATPDPVVTPAAAADPDSPARAARRGPRLQRRAGHLQRELLAAEPGVPGTVDAAINRVVARRPTCST